MDHTDRVVADMPIQKNKPGPARGWKRRLRSLLFIRRVKDTPRRIALGMALGIFIGFLPIMGIQMAVVSLLAIPLLGNLKAAIAGVWISNPITFIPLYYLCYRFGLIFFPKMRVSWAEFTGRMNEAANWDWTAIKSSLFNMLGYGTEILVPLWGGSVVLGVFFGLITYLVTHRWVVYYRSKKAAKIK